MIFITYRTSELKKINNHFEPRYKAINDFLKDKSIIDTPLSEMSIDTVIGKIDDKEEQLYYECVIENYSYSDNKDTNYIKLWSLLFSKAEEKINEISNNTKQVIKNNILIVNDNENLGPWQSMEVLTGIRHSGKVYWLSVDSFISIIKRTLRKYSDESSVNQKVAFVELLKKKWKKL